MTSKVDIPFTALELNLIDAWWNGGVGSPAPNVIVSVPRWIATVRHLQNQCDILHNEIKELEMMMENMRISG